MDSGKYSTVEVRECVHLEMNNKWALDMALTWGLPELQWDEDMGWIWLSRVRSKLEATVCLSHLETGKR